MTEPNAPGAAFRLDDAPRLTLLLAAALAAGLAASVLLIALDARTLDNGESVWLKPARFCLAFGVHLVTMVWIGAMADVRGRARRVFAAGLALQSAAVVVEMVCIGVQAARGVHSHFNYSTPFDHAVFFVMGLGTAVTLVGLACCALGVLHGDADRLVRRLLTGAMVLAVLGGLVGVWMVMPTAPQRLAIDVGQRLPWIGGTSVGNPSGATLPLFAWDLRSGDWRAAHFVGLHALQALPLLAWLASRPPGAGHRPSRLRWSGVGAAAYAAFFLAVAGWTAAGHSVLATSQPGWGWVVAPAVAFVAAVAVLVRHAGATHGQ